MRAAKEFWRRWVGYVRVLQESGELCQDFYRVGEESRQS